MKLWIADKHGSNVRFEVLAHDPVTGRTVLRGEHDEYTVVWDMTPKVKELRRENWTLTKEE